MHDAPVVSVYFQLSVRLSRDYMLNPRYSWNAGVFLAQSSTDHNSGTISLGFSGTLYLA